MIAEFHELLPACEVHVRAQPPGSTAVNAELAFETADEDVMVDGIEGCRKVDDMGCGDTASAGSTGEASKRLNAGAQTYLTVNFACILI